LLRYYRQCEYESSVSALGSDRCVRDTERLETVGFDLKQLSSFMIKDLQQSWYHLHSIALEIHCPFTTLIFYIIF